MDLKPTPKFCVKCGSPIKPGEKFCIHCGAQLVKNLYDKTVVEPTKIEPTEVKPTEVKPTEIKPTNIEPTEIKPTEIKPTNIEPTPIEPTPIEPTPIKAGVFNNRFFMFFIQPNILIWGIIATASSLLHTISVTAGGFQWWNIFTLLLMLGSLFEVVWGVIKAPVSKTNPDGSPKSKGKILGDKMKYIVKGNGPKPTPKNLVGVIGGGIGALALVIFILGSLFSGFKNHIVLDGYTFKDEFTGKGYNPETDYRLVSFYSGYKARETIVINGEVTFQVYGDYWRIGNDCGLKCKTLEVGYWGYWGYDEKWGSTLNFEIKSYRHLQSADTHFYRTV